MSSIFEKLAAQAVHSALEKQAGSGAGTVPQLGPGARRFSKKYTPQRETEWQPGPIQSETAPKIVYHSRVYRDRPLSADDKSGLEALKASLAGVGENIASRFRAAKDYASKKYNDINNSDAMGKAKEFAQAHKKGLIITGAGGALGTGGLVYGLSGKKDQAGDVAMGAGDAMGGGAGTPVTMPESGDTPFYKNPKYMIPAGLALGGLGLLGTGAYLSSSKKKKKRRSQDDDE